MKSSLQEHVFAEISIVASKYFLLSRKTMPRFGVEPKSSRPQLDIIPLYHRGFFHVAVTLQRLKCTSAVLKVNRNNITLYLEKRETTNNCGRDTLLQLIAQAHLIVGSLGFYQDFIGDSSGFYRNVSKVAWVMNRSMTGLNMKTLQRSALEALPKNQLKEVLMTFRNRGTYWRYCKYITENLTHAERKEVANALPALDEMAQQLHRALHKRVFRGK